MESKFARLRSNVMLLVVSLGLVVGGQTWAQTTTIEYEQAQLVSKLAKYVTWSKESEQPIFTIGVFDDAGKHKYFSDFFANKGVKGKDILVRLVKKSSETKDVNILYISSPNKRKSLNLTNKIIDDSNVLIITEGIKDLAQTMIDITYDDQDSKIKFRVVEDNIDNKKITIPELSYILSNKNDEEILSLSPTFELENQEAKKLLALQNKVALQEASLKKLNEELSSSNKDSKKHFSALQEESKRLKNALQEGIKKNQEIKAKDVKLQRLETQLQAQEVQLNMNKEDWQLADQDKIKAQEDAVIDLTEKLDKQSKITNSTQVKLTKLTDENKKLSSIQLLFYVSVIIAIIALLMALVMWKKAKNSGSQSSLEQENDSLLSVRERQLIKSESISAIGYIASDITYGVGLSLEDLHAQLDSSGDTKNATALKPVITLLDNFNLIAADQDDTEMQRFNVIAYMQKLMMLYEFEFNQTDIDYNYSGEKELMIKSVPSYIALALIHVINNALKHGFDNNGKGKIALKVEKGTKGGAEITFSDYGKGMSKAVLEQVCNPFFTTQSDRGYIGIGMSTTSDLVKNKLAGNITIESKEGKGTSVIITLP